MLTTEQINNAIDTFKSANILATVLYVQAKQFGFEQSIQCHKEALNRFNNFAFILENYDGCDCVNIDEIVCEIENISRNYMENCSDKLSREETLNLINLRVAQELAPILTAIGNCVTIPLAGDSLCTQISSNATNISTNAGNISTNATNIATNTANIATNTANIATNASNISGNTTNIATNAANIATNVTNISTNATNISTLQGQAHSIQENYIGVSTAGGTTTISVADTYTDVNLSVAMTTNNTNGFTLLGTSRPRFDGTGPKLFLCMYSFTISSAGATYPIRCGAIWERYDAFSVASGTFGEAIFDIAGFGAGSGKRKITGVGHITLDNLESFTLQIKNVTNTDNLVIEDLTYSILEIQS